MVFKINNAHPLLVWSMPTDFKAFGIASVIKARGISRNKYKAKNNTTSHNE
ncbi:hypothetical protein Bbad01_37380 [Bacillus badius]|nr:hypothetical protein Bbad01_37380 [Bacillus badius]